MKGQIDYRSLSVCKEEQKNKNNQLQSTTFNPILDFDNVVRSLHAILLNLDSLYKRGL